MPSPRQKLGSNTKMNIPHSQRSGSEDDYDSYDSDDRRRVTRGGKRGADYMNDSYAGDSQGYFANDMSRRGRKENGLVELTKKFIHLLKTAEE